MPYPVRSTLQALLMLEQPFAAKSTSIKEAVARMLTSAASTHGHMEVVVGGLGSLLGKHDHMGPLAAELAALSQISCQDDTMVCLSGMPLLLAIHGILEYDLPIASSWNPPASS